MSYDQNAQYFITMLSYAQMASSQTGIPTSAILAQWGHETGFGTSDIAINANNHGGIKFVNGSSVAATNYGAYAKYNSLDQFVQDYVRVMNLSYYNNVRSAGSPEAAIDALGKSPYAEDPQYGHLVLGIYTVYGLSGYDGGTTITSNLSQVSAAASQLPVDTAKLAAIGAAFIALLALTK